MPEPDDHQLLAAFARTGAEPAFAALVGRYVNLVYSTAFRFTSNPHHAQEITQAVFIILARKAGKLSSRVVLSGWLYQAARLTASNFLKGEIRRQLREQEVYMQSTVDEPAAAVWPEIAPMLDEAMGRLGQTDRDAVVLRYFENRSAAEIGAALRMNEEAARKRVNRALEKLRKFFARRGVSSTTTSLVAAISAHAIQAAPAALAKSVTTVAAVKGAAASVSTLTLVKTTLLAMKTKIIVAAAAAAVIILGTRIYLVGRSKSAGDSPDTRVTLPIRLVNDVSHRDANDPLFEIGVDPDTRRTRNSPPAILIKGPTRPAADAAEESTDALLQKRGNSSAIEYVVTKGSPLLGKRIQITGWIKCKDVRNWAAAYMCIWSRQLGFCRLDTMNDRNILRGTMGWQKVEFVTDVPNEPCEIYAGPDLYGPGELWGDDFQIALAPPDAVVNDDRAWHLMTDRLGTYSEADDYLAAHNGHPTVCVASASNTVPPGAWASWTRTIRAPDFDKYKGRSLRMSGWAKIAGVSGRFQPRIQTWSKRGTGGMSGNDSLKGTLNWTHFTATCAVTEDTRKIETSFILSGGGKVWIDMDSLEFEVVR